MPESRQVKPEFIIPEDTPLPGSLSNRQKAILALALFAIIVGIGYHLFSGNTIRLVNPGKRSALAAKDLVFRWECDKKEISFVLEVYDGENLIMRQITNETSYTPDTDQKLAFEANHTYSWSVIPNPDINQRYNFKTESQIFYITKALPPPVRPPQEIQPPPQTDQAPAQSKPQKSAPPRELND